MKKPLLLLLSALLLCGCNAARPSNSESPAPESNQSSVAPSSSQGSSSSSSSQSGQSSSQGDQSSSESASSQSIEPPSGGKLPCGWDIQDAPENTAYEFETSLSSAQEYKYEFTDEFPSDDWSYIYGNNITNGSFYVYNSSDTNQYPGGIKLDQRGKGFQSPLFHHSGAKLEINIKLSQVNKAGGKPDSSRVNDIASIYCFDASGNLLTDVSKVYKVEEFKSYLNESNPGTVKHYANSADIAYVEFRIHANPYKGSQNFNIGIGSISFKSWERI